MLKFDGTESLLTQMKSFFPHNSFAYEDPNISFRKIVTHHFGDKPKGLYGVYLIRQKVNREILYIGKGGTVCGDGNLKRQDIPMRLRNVRGNDLKTDHWVREMHDKRGSLIVEYFIIDAPIAPSYIEAALLQAFLAEHNRLPLKNNAF